METTPIDLLKIRLEAIHVNIEIAESELNYAFVDSQKLELYHYQKAIDILEMVENRGIETVKRKYL